MSVTILARRGTKSQLDTITLSAGEFGFTTDSGVEELYVGNGAANTLVGRVFTGLDAGKSSVSNVAGRGYFATDTGKLYINTGSGWAAASVASLDEVADGVNYQRVAASEVDASGRVTQINDGTNTVTAAQARTHLDSTSNPHGVTLTQAATAGGSLDDVADGATYQRVASSEVDASGRVTQVADGTNTVTAAQARTHLDSTSNPHGVTLTQAATAGGSLDDVADGTTYQKVAASEVDVNGYVTKINDATNVVTASQARTHLDSTSNPHSTSIANIGTGTLSNLNAALSDDVGIGLAYVDDAQATSAVSWSATKIQAVVDNAISGLSWKDAAVAATDDVLPACTYANGTAGVGATLTADANGALAAVDGVTLVAGNRVLVKNQAAGLQNGIYVVTTVGDAGTPFVLTRVTDCDTADELEGSAVLVRQGTTNSDTSYTMSTDNVTVGTTALVYVQFSGAGQVVAGTGLTKSGNIINVNLGAGIKELPTDEVGIDIANVSGLTVGAGGSADQLAIAPDITTGATVVPIAISSNGAGVTVDNSSVEHSTGTLRVKADGITAAMLNADTAGAGLVPNGTTGALDVNTGNGVTITSDAITLVPDNTTGVTVVPIALGANGVGVTVDNSSVEHSTGILRVKADGITAAMLNADTAGAGLVQNGTTGALDVNTGNGVTITSDAITLVRDTTTGATVAPITLGANGVGVTVDNTSIIHTSGTLSVAAIDGGSFA